MNDTKCAGAHARKATHEQPTPQQTPLPPPHKKVPAGMSGCIVVKLEPASDAARVLQLNDVILEVRPPGPGSQGFLAAAVAAPGGAAALIHPPPPQRRGSPGARLGIPEPPAPLAPPPGGRRADRRRRDCAFPRGRAARLLTRWARPAGRPLTGSRSWGGSNAPGTGLPSGSSVPAPCSPPPFPPIQPVPNLFPHPTISQPFSAPPFPTFFPLQFPTVFPSSIFPLLHSPSFLSRKHVL